jgi:hypothetical protein
MHQCFGKWINVPEWMRFADAIKRASAGVCIALSRSFSSPDGGMLNGNISSKFFIERIVWQTSVCLNFETTFAVKNLF